MRCARARRIVAELIESPASDAEQSELTKHLCACTGCREFRDQLAATWLALSVLPEIEPSRAFIDKFHAGLHSAGNRSASRLMSWWPSFGWQWMAVASVALALVFLVADLRQSEPMIAWQYGLTKMDRWDDKFLKELDQNQTNWESNYVPSNDPWPSSLLGPSLQEPPSSP